MDLLCDGARGALGSFLEASFPGAEDFKGAPSCTGLLVKRLMLLIGKKRRRSQIIGWGIGMLGGLNRYKTKLCKIMST